MALDPRPTSERIRERLVWPSFGWISKDPGRFIMFGFGSGLVRPAPGTWGTLLAWLIWHAAAPASPDWAIGIFLLVGFAYGCWAAHRVNRELGVSDHSGMVWDEMIAFWLVLWLTPATLWAQAWAFLLFRLFDILKPPPIRQFDQRLKNGFGAMFDDLLAAFYTVIVIAVAVQLGAPL